MDNSIISPTWIVRGNTRKTIEVGELRNETEGGRWVFWYYSCRAEVFKGCTTASFHWTYEQAEAEAERRWQARLEGACSNI
jgi:hypothetical protein